MRTYLRTSRRSTICSLSMGRFLPASRSSIRTCRPRATARPTTCTRRRRSASRRTSRATSATTRPGWSAVTTPYTWTSQPDNPLGNAYYARNTAEVVRAPTPLGASLRLTNDLTRVEGQLQPDQVLNTGIATLDFAFTPQLTLGLRGGYETSTYTATEVAGPVYGGSIAWRPTPLTQRRRLPGRALLRPELSVRGVAPPAPGCDIGLVLPHADDVSAGSAADSSDQQRCGHSEFHPGAALSGPDRARKGNPGPDRASGSAAIAAGRRLRL